MEINAVGAFAGLLNQCRFGFLMLLIFQNLTLLDLIQRNLIPGPS